MVFKASGGSRTGPTGDTRARWTWTIAVRVRLHGHLGDGTASR
jgi:hypothetical protein